MAIVSTSTQRCRSLIDFAADAGSPQMQNLRDEVYGVGASVASFPGG